MFALFNEAKTFLKHVEKVTTDNIVFRLHYKATVLLHIAFMCLLGAKQYFGEPILCNKTGEDRVMDVYCWIHGTWTIDELFRRVYQEQVAHPGVGYFEPSFQKVNHSYYQWIPVVLLLSAVCFYIPRYLWKSEERGRMSMITKGMKEPISSIDLETLDSHVQHLILFMDHRSNYLYAQRFAFCELLNFLNLLWQWFFFNSFLEGRFLTYGADYLQYYFESGIMGGPHGFNPMDKVFPKMAKCSYKQIAGEGGIQKKDAICTLPLNIINDRVFLILWFWFLILSCITALALVFRSLTILSRTMRRLTLSRFTSPSLPVKNAHIIIHRTNYHTWFLMYQIAKNVDPEIFDNFIIRFSKELESTLPSSSSARLPKSKRPQALPSHNGDNNHSPISENTFFESDSNEPVLTKKTLAPPDSPFIIPGARSFPTLRTDEKTHRGGDFLPEPSLQQQYLGSSPQPSPTCPPKSRLGKHSYSSSYDVS